MKKLVVCILLLFPLFSVAQEAIECETLDKNTSNITATELKGVVSDVASREPLNNVQVTIIAKTSDVTKSITTDEDGKFSFKEIPAGKYAINFERKGYRPFNYDAVWVNEGKTCSLGFPLYKKK